MLSFLTQMDNFGKLHVAASPILVDATDTEAVVAFTLHAVAGDLSWSGGLWGETLLPLLGAHFLSLHDKDGSSGGLAVQGRNPGEQDTVGTIHIHFDFRRADRGAVSCG